MEAYKEFPMPHGDIDRAWCLKMRQKFAQEEKAVIARGGAPFSEEKKAAFEEKMAANEAYVEEREKYHSAKTDGQIAELTAALTAVLQQVAPKPEEEKPARKPAKRAPAGRK